MRGKERLSAPGKASPVTMRFSAGELETFRRACRSLFALSGSLRCFRGGMLLGSALAHPRAPILGFFLARQQFIRTSFGVLGRFLLVMKCVLEPMVAAAVGAGLWRGEDEKRGEEQHRLAT